MIGPEIAEVKGGHGFRPINSAMRPAGKRRRENEERGASGWRFRPAIEDSADAPPHTRVRSSRTNTQATAEQKRDGRDEAANDCAFVLLRQKLLGIS